MFLVTKKKYDKKVESLENEIKRINKIHDDYRQTKKQEILDYIEKIAKLEEFKKEADKAMIDSTMEIKSLQKDIANKDSSIKAKDKKISKYRKSLNSFGGIKANYSKLKKQLEEKSAEIVALKDKIKQYKNRPTVEQLKRETMFKCDNKKYIDSQKKRQH